MTDDRVFTVPEVARFFGITPQAVRQRIVEGRLQASKVRVKGIAREYRISGEAIQEHYDLSDADMRRLASDTVRYRVEFMGWEHGPCGACVMTLAANGNVVAIFPNFGGGPEFAHAGPTRANTVCRWRKA